MYQDGAGSTLRGSSEGTDGIFVNVAKMDAYSEYRNRLDSLFLNEELTLSMSKEEKDRIINGLKYQQNTIELYQYRRCNDYSFNDFSSNRITLVHPQRFNDCFEIVPYVNLENLIRILRSFDANAARKFIDIAKSREFTQDELKQIGGQDAAEQLKMITSYLKTPEQENIFIENYDTFSQAGFRIILEKLPFYLSSERDKVRIACFSESYDSPIMWGHYADSGRGFCVKRIFPCVLNMSLCPLGGNRNFQECSSCISDSNNWLFPVIYKPERPDFSSVYSKVLQHLLYCENGVNPTYSNFNILSEIAFSCYKSIDWEYEKEWRFFHTLCRNSMPEYISVRIGNISALYLGEKISPKDEDKLVSYAQLYKDANGNPIPIYKMKTNLFGKDYKMDCKQIN